MHAFDIQTRAINVSENDSHRSGRTQSGQGKKRWKRWLSSDYGGMWTDTVRMLRAAADRSTHNRRRREKLAYCAYIHVCYMCCVLCLINNVRINGEWINITHSALLSPLCGSLSLMDKLARCCATFIFMVDCDVNIILSCTTWCLL